MLDPPRRARATPATAGLDTRSDSAIRIGVARLCTVNARLAVRRTGEAVGAQLDLRGPGGEIGDQAADARARLDSPGSSTRQPPAGGRPRRGPTPGPGRRLTIRQAAPRSSTTSMSSSRRGVVSAPSPGGSSAVGNTSVSVGGHGPTPPSPAALPAVAEREPQVAGRRLVRRAADRDSAAADALRLEASQSAGCAGSAGPGRGPRSVARWSPTTTRSSGSPTGTVGGPGRASPRRSRRCATPAAPQLPGRELARVAAVQPAGAPTASPACRPGAANSDASESWTTGWHRGRRWSRVGHPVIAELSSSAGRGAASRRSGGTAIMPAAHDVTERVPGGVGGPAARVAAQRPLELDLVRVGRARRRRAPRRAQRRCPAWRLVATARTTRAAPAAPVCQRCGQPVRRARRAAGAAGDREGDGVRVRVARALRPPVAVAGAEHEASTRSGECPFRRTAASRSESGRVAVPSGDRADRHLRRVTAPPAPRR